MIYLGSDHAGFDLKEKIKEFLRRENYEFEDMGAYTYDEGDDYPNYALKVCKKVLNGDKEKGILFCGTGQGMDIAANKVPGILAAVCWNEETAKNANKLNVDIITMGGRVTRPEVAEKIIKIWLNPIERDERHIRRIKKVKEIERQFFRHPLFEDDQI
jgi:ribose 5-phosphate isomerase B